MFTQKTSWIQAWSYPAYFCTCPKSPSFPVCQKCRPISSSERTVHHVILSNRANICFLFSLHGHVLVKLSSLYHFLDIGNWIQMLNGSAKNNRKWLTQKASWVQMMNSFRPIHCDLNHLTICCWNKFWVKKIEKISKKIDSKFSVLKKNTRFGIIYLNNLPYCSHRGSFFPVWSFWLFWLWCWWWALFVFSYIFESDHQTISIWTIEILKNYDYCLGILLVVWYNTVLGLV